MKKGQLFNIIAPSKVWRKLFSSVTDLTDAIRINISNEGIETRYVDPAHIAMGSMNIFPEMFGQFEIDSPINVAIDIDAFLDRLAKVPGHMKVGLEFWDDWSMFCRIYTPYGELTKRFFTLDPESISWPNIPNLELQFFNISPQALQNIWKWLNLGAISDHCIIKLEGDKLSISADGEKISYYAGTTTKGLKHEENKDDEKINCCSNKATIPLLPHKRKKLKNGVMSLFSLDYMDCMLKGVKGCDALTIGLGTDNPLQLNYNMTLSKSEPRGPSNHSEKTIVMEGSFLLAPRIESK